MGNAKLRDPALVARDVRDGTVSVEAARTLYGVALTPEGGVDMAATETLRAAP
jgi:N-methylhydantoinase B